MIRLFSELQEKGNPPEGIAPGFSMFWLMCALLFCYSYYLLLFYENLGYYPIIDNKKC